MQYSCFISYRREENDKRYITNLKKILQSEIFKVTNKNRAFLDNDSIRYGEEFDLRIYSGIENSFFFIPIWYDNYLHKDNLWCARELYYAREVELKIKSTLPEKDKANFYFIIPLLIRGDASDLPNCLSTKSTINIKLLETDIANNKVTTRLTNFKNNLYNSLRDYFKTISEFSRNINLNELLSSIEKPDDETLINWVKLQKREMLEKESKKFPQLKKTNE